MRNLTMLLGAMSLLSTGCQAEYHPYNTRIDGECGINAKNTARIEQACADKRTIRFAVISDTQRWYDETRDAVRALNARDDLDFVLHTGDMADFGMTAEFERQRDILGGLDVPYVCIIGNHDCLGNGKIVFRKIFGDFDFAFTAGNVRFVCVNTNALEFDHSVTGPNFPFIEEELRHFPAEAEKTVFVMHTSPDSEQSDPGLGNIFQQHIKQFPALQFCVHGHGHHFTVNDIFGDGVLYYECDAISQRSYLLFTLNDEGYAYERIFF